MVPVGAGSDVIGLAGHEQAGGNAKLTASVCVSTIFDEGAVLHRLVTSQGIVVVELARC